MLARPLYDIIWNRKVTWTVAAASYVLAAMSLSARRDLPPAPLRFPEAQDAFLYSHPDGGIGVPILAVCALSLGLLYLGKGTGRYSNQPVAGSLLLVAGAILALAGPLFVWRDS